MILVVSPTQVETALERLAASGESAYLIGSVERRPGAPATVVA
jgi:phosphoribosylaminoimidazole (AIR) synthetase